MQTERHRWRWNALFGKIVPVVLLVYFVCVCERRDRAIAEETQIASGPFRHRSLAYQLVIFEYHCG